uniref:NADH-ubiquinone oxidoreductase chain 1 n=1 Tax=Dipseudopsis sp. XG-2021 TaxID=2996733 RepID=A0A9E8LNT5_9NEOP|nr:NADH dehydrogenase subunit 1 [Dipseudopsis sp. XG-2021]
MGWLLLIYFLLIIIGVLVGVAFLTLLERKVLGFIQIRKGPNKVGLMGVFQPFSDAIKLFSKEQVSLDKSNFFIYFITPYLSLLLSLFIWLCYPMGEWLFNFSLGALFVLSCLGLGVYMVMISGWSSNSMYAMLGSMRAVAQTLSYEVSLMMILLMSLLLIMDLGLWKLEFYQESIWFIVILIPMGMVLISVMLAETNRSPFDFVEGESELVSGFNVEYAGFNFSFIFLAEYGMILFMSSLFSMIYLGSGVGKLLFCFKILLVSFIFIWVRGTYPRFRYDKLMMLAWKLYLPVSLCFFFVVYVISSGLIYLWNFFGKN